MPLARTTFGDSITENLGRVQEFPAAAFAEPSWYGPHVQLGNGALQVPNGPGIGITIDDQYLAKAQRLT